MSRLEFKKQSKISINIVTWNSQEYIKQCLDSITQQTFKNFSVLIIDNASTDNTIKYVSGFNFLVLRNEENLGFAAAHNQGIKQAIEQGADFVLVMNPDIILEPNYLEELMKVAERERATASFGGKLLSLTPHPSHQQIIVKQRYKAKPPCGFIPSLWKIIFRKGAGLTDKTKSDIIDSTGLKVLKNRKVIEEGGGEKDGEQYNQSKEVFGISGASALYRVSALEDVRLKNEYFDEDFFVYKEDVDLAWRLQLAGWRALYVPGAVAYHARTAKEGKNRQERAQLINYHSYKNHLFLLLKNETLGNFLLHSPFILWYEFKKFIYLLLFERATLKALGEVFKKLPVMLAKRKTIMRRRG